MLAQLAGQVQPHGGLDLPARDGVLLVVVRQAGGLGGDALEDVVHEGVHDAHGFAGDAGVGVDLLQDLVDVDRVALFAGLSFVFPLALRLHGRFLLSFLARYFSWHSEWLSAGLAGDLNLLLRLHWTLSGIYFRKKDHFWRII